MKDKIKKTRSWKVGNLLSFSIKQGSYNVILRAGESGWSHDIKNEKSA